MHAFVQDTPRPWESSRDKCQICNLVRAARWLPKEFGTRFSFNETDWCAEEPACAPSGAEARLLAIETELARLREPVVSAVSKPVVSWSPDAADRASVAFVDGARTVVLLVSMDALRNVVRAADEYARRYESKTSET